MKRVIYIEPKIDNEIITRFFNKYNPDSKFVKPHICLVFPFNSELTTSEINNIFDKVISNIACFNLTLKGITISYECNNNFIFVNVVDTNNILSEISKDLYSELGDYALLKTDKYIPHVTIAKNKSIEVINSIYTELVKLNDLTIQVTVDKIYSKIMIKDDMGSISLQNEIEYRLKRYNNKNRKIRSNYEV